MSFLSSSPPLARLGAAAAAAALLLATVASTALADQRDFDVVNSSSIDLQNLYVSPADSQTWGDDIMGTDVLAAGSTVHVTFPNYDPGSCLYDIKVLGKAGESSTLRQVDLCTVTTVTFSN